jgi:ATP/maltotriose-dependent transcriptional regulator MalT
VDDRRLAAAILWVGGMNLADHGRHTAALALLEESVKAARSAQSRRQEALSLGALARSLLLSGQPDAARRAAERSIALATDERWNAYLPWPQVIRAQCLAEADRWEEAGDDAERAFALACQLGDPCWEGMAGRALGLLAAHAGDLIAARAWIADARRRCDRLPDRYVWVSAYIGLAELEIAAREHSDLVAPLAAKLHDDAARYDLPEFLAWALVYQAEGGDRARAALAIATAEGVDNPALKARVRALIREVAPG